MKKVVYTKKGKKHTEKNEMKNEVQKCTDFPRAGMEFLHHYSLHGCWS